MGRVSPCIDSLGQVHVVWFDNRAGWSGQQQRDSWHVVRSKSTTFGSSWSTGQVITSAASVGGYATPHPAEHVPPGDFLSCDADRFNLYIVWPDSRGWLPGGDQTPRIFIAVVAVLS